MKNICWYELLWKPDDTCLRKPRIESDLSNKFLSCFFVCVCVVSCNICAFNNQQSTSPMKLIHTRDPLARQEVVFFRFRGIQSLDKWEKWFFIPPTQSQGVRIEDKPDNCQETCLEQSDLFFFTTQIRIKTTKCNSFPPIQSILHDYPSLQNIGKKMELSKLCSIFFPLAPLLETNKQTSVSTFH